jgi:murein L,D-transpeptidase YcbB/YkuD
MVGVKKHHPQYTQLQSCLRNIQAHNGGATEKPSAPYSLIPGSLGFCTLIHVLQRLHFLPQGTSFSLASVTCALKQVQRIHGFPETGTLDAQTRKSLYGNQDKLISHIKKAIAQWRQLGCLPPHCLVTNIPSFHQEIIHHGYTHQYSRVMVGKLESKTPIFSGFIYALVFNPTWIIPRTRYKDFGPCVGKDGIYRKNGMLFQKPGPKNHLGQVKFLTKRSDAIIFHSTHEPQLFNQAVRAFSLGCVRVQDCIPMAKYILDTSGISLDIGALLKQKISKVYTLSSPFPVYVVYQTLWIKDGIFQVYQDIYGRKPTAQCSIIASVTKKICKKDKTNPVLTCKK